MISAISNVDFSYNDLQDYTDEEAAAFKGHLCPERSPWPATRD